MLTLLSIEDKLTKQHGMVRCGEFRRAFQVHNLKLTSYITVY